MDSGASAPGGEAARPGKYFDPLVLARIAGLSVVARHVVEGLMAGLHRSSLHGLSMEFSEHRPYVPGDELRHIDWKLFARQDRYFVKEYEAETNLKAYIFLDVSASMGYGGEGGVTKLQYGSFIAASLAHLMLLQRDSVGLAAMGESADTVIPPRSRSNHLKVLIDTLEKLEPSGKTNIERSLEKVAATIRRRALFIIISDFIDEPERLELGIKHLRHRKNDIMVFHLHDRSELDLPFEKMTLFRDLEDDLEITTDPRAIRREYREVVEEHFRGVKDLCHAHGADYGRFVTDEPLHRSLVRYLARRGRS